MPVSAKPRKPRKPRQGETLGEYLGQTQRKLDLGGGQHPMEGFEGVDLYEGATHVVDLFGPEPWPFADDSVDEVFSSHLVEHIPHGEGRVDGWYRFFNEVWRICKPEAKVLIVHPYGKNNRAFQDPTHRRYIVEETWNYLNRGWLEANGIEHYTGFVGDFEIVTIAGTGMNTQVAMRSAEAQTQAREWYWNVIPDLQVELRVRKS